MQGEGGYIVPPQKFFDELTRITEKHGILLVCDEVQSGMGRTGKMWASEHFHLAPDIMTVAKGIASGLPLGATVARADLMSWAPGAHASTFGGNPVACAAALVTIELLEQELLDNAARMGAHLMARMRDWPARFPIVGDVRGLGLMLGVELVRDQQSKTKAPELRDRVVDLAFERGLLILGAGDNTLRLCPALIITRDQCDFALDTLEECLTLAMQEACPAGRPCLSRFPRRLGTLLDPQFPRRAQRAGQHVRIRRGEPDMRRPIPPPASGDREEHFRQFRDKRRLLFQRQHQIAVPLLLRGQGGEYPASDPKIRRRPYANSPRRPPDSGRSGESLPHPSVYLLFRREYRTAPPLGQSKTQRKPGTNRISWVYT